MIGHADIDALEGRESEAISELFDRRHAISDLPDDLDKIEAWDEFIEDCERVGFPHLIASARIEQYTTLMNGGMTPQAIDTYIQLMQVIHRHGDLIAPANVEIALDSVATAIYGAVDDASISLDRMTRVVDLVEAEVRARNADIAGVFFARATVASSAGQAKETLAWLERWRAQGSEHWKPDSLGGLQMEVPLVARVDIVRADEILTQRLGQVGIDHTRLGEDEVRSDSVLSLLTMQAFFRRQLGRFDEVDSITAALLGAFGMERLRREATLEYLISILEPRPA